MTSTIWGFDSWQQQEYSPQASRSALGPTQPPIQCVLRVPSSGSNSLGVKLTAHPHLGPRLTMSAAAPLHPYMPYGMVNNNIKKSQLLELWLLQTLQRSL